MKHENRIAEIALELQAITRSGLTYVKDPYDKERFEIISHLAAELLSFSTGLEKTTLMQIFDDQRGYQTPKVETRGVVIKDEKLLLVKEKGKWALPGGWMDYNLSVSENTIKEVEEESGYRVEVENIIAVQNRNLHNFPKNIFEVIKIFAKCRLIDGGFKENMETSEAKFFTQEEASKLELDVDKTTLEQVNMCFELCRGDGKKVVFD